MTILSTAPVIDATGIRAPGYGEVLQYFKDQYRAIYGADTYLEADSQDGQLLGTAPADDRLWWTPEAGSHDIVVTDQAGRSDRQTLTVRAGG